MGQPASWWARQPSSWPASQPDSGPASQPASGPASQLVNTMILYLIITEKINFVRFVMPTCLFLFFVHLKLELSQSSALNDEKWFLFVKNRHLKDSIVGLIYYLSQTNYQFQSHLIWSKTFWLPYKYGHAKIVIISSKSSTSDTILKVLCFAFKQKTTLQNISKAAGDCQQR